MQKKLTITIAEDVYHGLHAHIRKGKISSFIQELVRPHVESEVLEKQYFMMSMDEEREKEALEWSELDVGKI